MRSVRIGNSSGFYGDRNAASLEMVEGGPIDFLTGDYLAELTMLILWKARQKDPSAGYARSVLGQLEQVLGTCLDRGIKIVNNAGGLNPAGLAEELTALAERLGLHPKIAYLTGDDLLPDLDALIAAGHDLAHLDTGRPLAEAGGKPVTANAYLGAWGIVDALGSGADIVDLPAGHRRLARRRAGRLVARLGPRRLRPAGRRRAGRPRDRVRTAGHRRQLLLHRRDRRSSLSGLPDRRGGRRRQLRDHQARRTPAVWSRSAPSPLN